MKHYGEFAALKLGGESITFDVNYMPTLPDNPLEKFGRCPTCNELAETINFSSARVDYVDAVCYNGHEFRGERPEIVITEDSGPSYRLAVGSTTWEVIE